MKKEIVMVALLYIAVGSGFTIGKATEQKQVENMYPLSTIVTEIKDNSVTVEDTNGNLWSFNGAEDWEVGDGCSLLMDNNGTNNIEDDIIISTQYCYNDWSIPYMYSNLKIVDWNTDGSEIAFMLSDGTELYAYKTESVYNK